MKNDFYDDVGTIKKTLLGLAVGAWFALLMYGAFWLWVWFIRFAVNP